MRVLNLRSDMFSARREEEEVTPTDPPPRELRFQLKEPEKGAICPITQGRISKARLEFFPKTTFDMAQPKKKAALLECGHEFSAMHLLYFWMSSDHVLCPLCRGGPKGVRVDPYELPPYAWKAVAFNIGRSSPVDLPWFMRNSLICVMEGEGLKDRVCTTVYCLGEKDGYFHFHRRSPEVEAFLKSTRALRILVKVTTTDTEFEETGWMTMPDDGKVLIKTSHRGFSYTVDKELYRVGFSVEADLFKREVAAAPSMVTLNPKASKKQIMEATNFAHMRRTTRGRPIMFPDIVFT
jgi:hypothetical protein